MEFRQLGRHRGGSRRWIMRSVENSLRRLGTDYLDLYQPVTDEQYHGSRTKTH